MSKQIKVFGLVLGVFLMVYFLVYIFKKPAQQNIENYKRADVYNNVSVPANGSSLSDIEKSDLNEQALKAAKNYLSESSFSRDGLINRLKFNKFKDEQINRVVQKLEVEKPEIWDEQALRAAENYLNKSGFSKHGLIDRLKLEKFTNKQANNAVQTLDKHKNVDWDEQAFKAAENYLCYFCLSREGLLNRLQFNKFTKDQANRAVSRLESAGKVDWNEQVLKQAESYVAGNNFSKQKIINQLRNKKFTKEQAENAVNIVLSKRKN